MEYLSKLDPDTIVIALTAIGALATWLYRKARGRETASFRVMVLAGIEAEIEELLEDDERRNEARACLERAAWYPLERLQVKRSRILELLVHELVEWGLAELRKRLVKRAVEKVPAQLGELVAQLRANVDAFAAAESRGRANPLIPPGMVELTLVPTEEPEGP